MNNWNSSHIPYNNDFFGGIIRYIEKSHEEGWPKNHQIRVKSSSTESGECECLLVVDSSYWRSHNIKNSWVQFDFLSRSVELEGYTMSSYNGPVSWRVEGSNNMIDFETIDNRICTDDFQRDCSHNGFFSIKKLKGPHRFIRITQAEHGDTYGDHIFQLERVEFFGNLYTK